MNLSFSLPYPLSLFVWRISISSLPSSSFYLPVQFFDWQVIISLPIFRGKTVIHWRRHVAALWTSSLPPVESCDLPSASRSEKPKETHAPDSYHSISKHMILSLFFLAEEWWFYWEEQSRSLSDWREAEDMLLLEEGQAC